MRTHATVVLMIALLSAGCTHNFLKESTLRSSGTLSTLQSQQVLNNLALLASDPAANVCHVNLISGTVQATDQGAASILGHLFSTGLASDNSLAPSISGQRTLVQQWVVNPVTDGEQLETLKVAYSRALNPYSLEVEDEIIDEIIGLCVRFSILPQKETITRILNREEPGESDKPNTKVRQLIKSLDAEIEQFKERLVILQKYETAWAEEKTKASLDLQLQILELNERIGYKTSQRDELSYLWLGIGNDTSIRKPAVPSRDVGYAKQSAMQSDTVLLILTVLQAGVHNGYLPSTDLVEMSPRNAALVDQAEDQLKRLESLLFDPMFQQQWICCGTKKDVPHDACYVGLTGHCNGTYVWIDRQSAATLREFTQIIMTLAAQNTLSETPSFGPVFSPAR